MLQTKLIQRVLTVETDECIKMLEYFLTTTTKCTCYFVVTGPNILKPSPSLSVVTTCFTKLLQHIYTLCLKKTRHLIFYHNFGKCEPIFKILSQSYS